MKEISVHDFMEKPISLWLKKWFALTSGDMQNHNAMTIAWGSIGGMWHKPFVQVVVRPNRYTYEFMEKFPTFTICAFDDTYKAALNILGTRSGRDGDKIAEAGLTVVESASVEAPSFKEAQLVLECKKSYWQDMDPKGFLDSDIEKQYPQKDYHRIYYGEIVRIAMDE